MKRLTMNDINAYLDGALPDADRREVEAALATDPAARALYNQYRRQSEELHRLYDPVLDEPVPERLLELLRPRAGKPD